MIGRRPRLLSGPGLTRPAAAERPGPGGGPHHTATQPGMVTLFSVAIRHGYYNLADERCSDFTVVPCPASAALMARLGLLFRDQGDGFSVVMPAGRGGALTSLLADRGSWTRLTFFLVLRNADFIGFTALPLDTAPTRQALYASNLETHERNGQLRFGTAAGPGASALHPITQGDLSVPTSADAQVTVSDISGQTVASAEASAGSPASLSLAGSPYGLYTIAGQPASAYAGPSEVVFVPVRPLATAMIDLLFTQPESGAGASGAFPVASAGTGGPGGGAGITTVDLTLRFDSRRTIWQYYVISQDPRGSFGSDLTITGQGSTFSRASEPVTLPSGEQAVLFSSADALALHQRSPYRFSLSGQRNGLGGSRDDISVERLPAAAAAPVWPAPSGTPGSGASEIFVHV